MNKKVLFLCSLCCSALIGCNGIGSGEDRLARVDNETVYVEDLDLGIKLASTGRAELASVMGGILTRTAVVSKALKDYPELGSRWETYSKNLQDRLLTLVYQRYYSMECLTYSDADLRNYFNTHRSEFVKDSAEVEYLDVRGTVAEHLLLSREAEKFKASGLDTMMFIRQYRQNLMEASIQGVMEGIRLPSRRLYRRTRRASTRATRKISRLLLRLKSTMCRWKIPLPLQSCSRSP